MLQYSAALFAGDGSVIEGSGSSAGDGVFNSGQFGKMCQMFSCKKYICIIFCSPGGLGVTGRPGGDRDGLGGTGIPIIGLRPGNKQ